MTRPLLTVLTKPIPGAPERAYRGLRRAARVVVKPGVPPPAEAPYPGHEAVVRSAVEGLKEIGADFNFNPDRVGAVGKVVYAPANEALRQAAALKREQTIARLVAGPVNALFPAECDGILLLPEIDIVIVASPWVRDLYASIAPALDQKVRVCQAGVETEYWKPEAHARAERAVVYWKSGSESFCEDVEREVRRCGLEPVRIRYGYYGREMYKRALADAVVAVFISDFETQGLALAEAWSMDVPTVVWDPRAPTEWRGHPFVAGSSCPFLTPMTGVAWQTRSALDAGLRKVLQTREAFAPRQWVVEHMTDAICAAKLYGISQAAARR